MTVEYAEQARTVQLITRGTHRTRHVSETLTLDVGVVVRGFPPLCRSARQSDS